MLINFQLGRHRCVLNHINQISFFKDVANCITKKTPFEFQPEGGFIKEAETCR